MFSSEEEEFPNSQKKTRILKAVKENDVESLRTLLDSPKLYKIKDEFSYTLLQIAILRENEEIFDYLLSLKDYPLEAINDAGETALATSLSDFVTQDLYIREHFALELIVKGANVHGVTSHNSPFLHCAFQRDFIDVAKLLIEKGVGIDKKNDEGFTPLHMCCIWCSDENLVEGVSMLLYFGADPTIQDPRGLTAFDILVTTSSQRDLGIAEENLFFYLFDEHTRYSIDAGVLLKAAETESQFFDDIVKHVEEVVVNDSLDLCPKHLFLMKPPHLQVFLEKFGHVIKAALYSPHNVTFYYTSRPIYPDNCYTLVESKLQGKFTDWLCNTDIEGVIQNFIEHGKNEPSLTQFVCFLVSYRMTVHTTDLHLIFSKFRYCELLKILLHMDVEEQITNYICIMPRLLYDVTLDIQKMIENPLLLSLNDLREILPFYAVSKLKDLCSELSFIQDTDVYEKVTSQPQIPLLLELARNVFRKYYVQRLNITNSRQFYTLLKRLPISRFHKKIITLEVPLY